MCVREKVSGCFARHAALYFTAWKASGQNVGNLAILRFNLGAGVRKRRFWRSGSLDGMVVTCPSYLNGFVELL